MNSLEIRASRWRQPICLLVFLMTGFQGMSLLRRDELDIGVAVGITVATAVVILVPWFWRRQYYDISIADGVLTGPPRFGIWERASMPVAEIDTSKSKRRGILGGFKIWARRDDCISVSAAIYTKTDRDRLYRALGLDCSK